MVRQGVHHDGESQKMAAGRKEEEQQLSNLQDIAPDGSHQDLAGIRHAVNMRISSLELSDDIAGIRGDDAEADNQDNGTVAR